MRKLINKLKERPENARRVIVFGLSLGLTVVIALLWITTLKTTQTAGRNDSEDGFKPFTLLKNSFEGELGGLNFGKQGGASAESALDKSKTSSSQEIKVYTNSDNQTEVLIGSEE